MHSDMFSMLTFLQSNNVLPNAKELIELCHREEFRVTFSLSI